MTKQNHKIISMVGLAFFITASIPCALSFIYAVII